MGYKIVYVLGYVLGLLLVLYPLYVWRGGGEFDGWYVVVCMFGAWFCSVIWGMSLWQKWSIQRGLVMWQMRKTRKNKGRKSLEGLGVTKPVSEEDLEEVKEML